MFLRWPCRVKAVGLLHLARIIFTITDNPIVPQRKPGKRDSFEKKEFSFIEIAIAWDLNNWKLLRNAAVSSLSSLLSSPPPHS